MAANNRRFAEIATKKHEDTIRQYLYDEGPTTIDDLVGVIGMSKHRTGDILAAMRAEGVVENSLLRGNFYWLLAEDAEANAA